MHTYTYTYTFTHSYIIVHTYIHAHLYTYTLAYIDIQNYIILPCKHMDIEAYINTYMYT